MKKSRIRSQNEIQKPLWYHTVPKGLVYMVLLQARRSKPLSYGLIFYGLFLFWVKLLCLCRVGEGLAPPRLLQQKGIPCRKGFQNFYSMFFKYNSASMQVLPFWLTRRNQ